jgi:uncharacterized membrane protein
MVERLLALLPHLDDYVISFVVLCLFWLAHLRLLNRIRTIDVPFTWFNLAFLLFTTFVPTTTTLIGDNSTQPLAAIVYGSNLLAILLCEALMWRRGALYLSGQGGADAKALWKPLKRRFVIAAGIIVLGNLAALVEIEVGTNVGYASYVYLLLIGAGIVRRDHDTGIGRAAPMGGAEGE